MKSRLLISLFLILVAISAGAIAWMQEDLRFFLPTGVADAEAAVGVASATPSTILANQTTEITLTIQITDSRLLAGSVNLQRLDASGKVVSVLGTLNDTGSDGDAVANDKMFTIRRNFIESSAAPVFLRVSWALRGVLKRAVSNTITLVVSEPLTCGATAGDLAAVATVRAEAETICPCSAATDTTTYVACVMGIANTAVTNGTLPAQCKNTMVQAALLSTCGQPTGAVPCCQRSATEQQTCSIVPSADQCLPLPGGSASVGTSTSCLDACLPSCNDLQVSDTEITAAVTTALKGVPEPWGSGFGLVLARTAAELRCRFPDNSPTSFTVSSPVAKALSEQMPAPATPLLQSKALSSTPDCNTSYCRDVNYCGPGNLFTSISSIAIAVIAPTGDTLVNRACFHHDLCYEQTCVHGICAFSGKSHTTDCDKLLFDTCSDPGISKNIWDRIVCSVASGLKDIPRLTGICEFPPCGAGEQCNQDTQMCEAPPPPPPDPCAGVTCSEGQSCNSSTGNCEAPPPPPDLCAGVTCSDGQSCNSSTGSCESLPLCCVYLDYDCINGGPYTSITCEDNDARGESLQAVCQAGSRCGHVFYELYSAPCKVFVSSLCQGGLL